MSRFFVPHQQEQRRNLHRQKRHCFYAFVTLCLWVRYAAWICPQALSWPFDGKSGGDDGSLQSALGCPQSQKIKSTRIDDVDTAHSWQNPPQLQRRQERQQSQRRPYRRVKVLHGIFSADMGQERVYRQRHRDLFALWNDPRVCTLHDYVSSILNSTQRLQCELIYTFVLGSNPNHTTSVELLHNASRPWLVDRAALAQANTASASLATDLYNHDMLHLNIRENMNDGKSTTWFAYASSLATTLTYDDLKIDYITKCDSDTVLSLHDFFRFAYWHMPPSPYNALTYICARPMPTTHHAPHKHADRFYADNYRGTHIYCSGELYMMDTALAVAVTREAAHSCHYCTGYEDIDMASRVLHIHAVKLTMVSRRLKYWTHGVKNGTEPWASLWRREQMRMSLTTTGDGAQRWTTKSTHHDMLQQPHLQADTLC